MSITRNSLRTALLCLSFSLTAGAQDTFGPNLVLCNKTAAPAGNDPVFNNLTHYWSMDEASGTRADSKGSVNLSEVNGTVDAVTGLKNSAAETRAAAASELDSSAWTEPAVFSMSVWFNFPALAATGDALILTTKVGDFFIQVEDGDSSATHGTALTFSGSANVSVASTISQNAWHLAVVVADGTNLKVSLDGGTFSSAVGTVTPSSSVLQFIDGNNGMPIKYDEIGFYNVALTQGNATTLWNGGAGTFYRP